MQKPGAQENPHAVSAVRSVPPDPSGSGAPAEHPRPKARSHTHRELLNILGFSSLSRLILVLVLEIVVAFFVLAFAVALVSDDLPGATLWQRLQVLLSARPTMVFFLLTLASAIVVPTFIWFHVTFLWILVLWRRWRMSRAEGGAPTGPPEWPH